MKKILKRSLSVFLAITILLSSVYAGLCQVDFSGLFAVKAKAVSGGTCGSNLTWEIDDNNTLIISGTGDMNNFSIDEHNIHHTPWENHRLSIKAIVIESGVTSIGEDAFADFFNLSSVTLCDTITTISSNAFRNCFGLTAIVIPSSVKCIDGYAFGDCKNLASITLPDGITGIDGYAFYNTTYFNNDSNWENGVLYIDNYLLCAARSLDGACAVKDGTKIIAKNAFEYCKNLTSVVIPNSVTHIGQYAFGDCTSLTSVTISTSVVRIENGVFSGCSSLSSISIPSNVTSIGSYAFSDCSSLSSISIPSNVTSIGRYAFSDCTSLVSITIPDTVTNISSDVFYNTGYYNDENNWEDGVLYINNHLICAYKYDSQDEYTDCIEGDYSIKQGTKTIADSAFSNCLNLTSLVIPNTVEYIGASAFRGCTSLASITIPDSVTSIGGSAFCGCTSLASITIPASVTNISKSVFRGCTGLTAINVNENNNNYSSVNGVLFNKEKTLLIQYPSGKSDEAYIIPDTVKIIGDFAFLDCESLTLVTMPDGLTEIGSNVFENCVNLISIEIPDSVTEIGGCAFYNCTNLSSVVISEKLRTINCNVFEYCRNLKSIEIPDSVTEICAYAFSCSGLTTITIPGNVTSIGGSAFVGCSNLVSATISNGVTKIGGTAFYNCRYLESVTIPDSVISIGGAAFGDCASLEFVSVGKNVTDIGGYVFERCYSLARIEWNAKKIKRLNDKSNLFEYAGSKNGIKVIFGDGVEEIPDYLFSCSVSSSPKIVSVSIPSSVKRIGHDAFGGGWRLESVYINDVAAWCSIDFEEIGSNPLVYAKYLYINGVLTTDVIIPDTVTSISDYAFYGFENLTSITIPDSVTYIGDYAFYGCTALTSIIIPDSVTYIGDYAFRGCTALTSITIPDTLTEISYEDFYNTGYYNDESNWENGILYIDNHLIKAKETLSGDCQIKNGTKIIAPYAFQGCTNVMSIKIPDTVTNIGYYSFDNCLSLASIEIPESVTNISHGAFYNCSSLALVSIPDSVTSIGEYAFYKCSSLNSITIPKSVTKINNYAFQECSSLALVSISESVTSIGDGAFYNCDGLNSVYVTSINSWCNISFEGYESNPLYYADNLYLNGELVTEVVVPDSVTEIQDYVFSIKNLITLTIPVTVTKIEESAFNECTALKYVFYTGSEAQWNKLLEENDITKFTNIPVHYGTKEHTLEWKNAQDFDCVNKPVNYKHKMCTVCGYISETKEILTNGHLFVNDICEYCSVPVYAYSIVNNEVTITAYNGPDKKVVIPSNFDGYPVTSIGKSAFCNNKAVESVVIPNSVTIIDEAAFEGCENLKSVNIPYGVTIIGDSAFSCCENLTSVIIPDSVTSIGGNAFYYCRSLGTIEIPDSVIYLGEAVFDSCYELYYVSIGSGLREIPYGSFESCQHLGTILMSESVTGIKGNAFFGCSAIWCVFYPGTEEQWSSMVVDSGNSSLKEASIHYEAIDHVASDTWENSMDFKCNSGEPGTLYKNCVVCDITLETKEIPPGHYFENDVCIICGCEYWEYEIVDGNVTITGYNGKNNEVVIPSVIDGYPVTRIGNAAFIGLTKLTSITIPDSVTTIGGQAFEGCESLTSIVIPDGVTEIGIYVFSECKSLTSVFIPNSVTKINYYAFYGCTSLASVSIPDSVTEIESNAFGGCTSLTSVIIPKGVNWFHVYAFEGCTNLTNIDVSEDNSSLSSDNGVLFNKDKTTLILYPFGKTESDYIIPDTVVNIGKYAFRGSANLKSVFIPKSVKSVEDYAFSGCVNLIDVYYNNKEAERYKIKINYIYNINLYYATWHYNTSDWVIKDATFVLNSDGNGYTIADCSVDCSGEVRIPETYRGLPVTAIGTDAFRDCSGITSVVVPDCVTSIGGSAFRNCTNLTKVDLPQNITTIPGAMCYGCEKLENIIIPDGVISIGGYAFTGCASLKTAVIPDSVKASGSSIFANCKSLVMVCNENSAAHNYAVNSNVSYIVNSDDTIVDLVTGKIQTNVLGGNMQNVISGSDNLTFTTDATYAGTGAVITVEKDGTPHSQYTLVVNGDTNGDSVCDVLDCFDVERASNGNAELSGAYAIAADSNSDEIINATDYQIIVNKAID